MDRQQLRKQMRVKRRTLSRKQQTAASEGLKRVLTRNPILLGKKRLAFYLATDGEISTQPLLEWKITDRGGLRQE